MFREMKYSREYWPGLLALACAGLLGAACVLSPNDGSTVASRTSSVSFSGNHPTPSKTILLQAFAPALGSFVTIGAAVSSSTAYRYDGVELFGWSASLVIPSSHWQPGRGGHFARLRARDSDNNDLNTFLPSWQDCLGAHPELDDFINSCRSPRSPEVFIYTADFTTSVDLLIENIRRGGPGLLVRVRNQGRHGKVMGIDCSHLGAAAFQEFEDPLRTGETKEYGVPVATAPGQIVVCTVFGVNEDGTAEVPIDNNTRTQVVF